MDPQQMAQLQQLQGMYGSGQQPPQRGPAFQPQAFQVQNRPLAPAGGGGGQAAPASAGAAPGGGGGQQQGGGQGGGGWAQTLMPLMKGLQGMMRPGQPQGGAAPGGMQQPGMAGPPIVQNQNQMGPFMGEMAGGGVPNGIVNSWPYAR